jgi:hypothetical protein
MKAAMIADIEIHHAAQELVERYGANALSVAEERVAALSKENDQSGMNVALRVLSALETLLEKRRQ